ncbi:hypothetical protein N780_05455 [Pontibacillus chungwhensis BH030062]|uniref:Uncharacterized protein n=1 Tax=Pontibacillus chungwhensis BH030062 TaxID=1385513 RepID=A0A0A2UV67_9BACI|nr:hypothetical protein [Pontibacillus chungwhensis]KGP90356.1 hypothetical protein N780_05455 [Pontibacillus chungwhensis BH030062]
MYQVSSQQRRRLLHSFFKSANSCLELTYVVKICRQASAKELRTELDCEYIKILSSICKWFEIWEGKIECLMRITPIDDVYEWAHDPAVKEWKTLHMKLYKEMDKIEAPFYSNPKFLELFHVLDRINRWIDTWKSDNNKARIWINPAIEYIKANDP